MKLQKQTVHVIDFLFTVALLVFFAASALLAVVIGANVYKTTTQNMAANYDSRTSIAYVTEKIRQHDTKDCIYVDEAAGIPCLMFKEDYGGECYTTYIYAYNGKLMEFFGNDALDFEPSGGQEILPVTGFDISRAADGLYTLTITDTDQNTVRMYISVRSEGGPV